MTAASDVEPYKHLAAMLERELELVVAGRLDELADAVARRCLYAERLGAVPPVSAREVLERVATLHEHVALEAARRAQEVLADALKADRLQRASRAYAPARRVRYSTSA